MKAAQDARANKILETKARYDGVVMTRREFLLKAKKEGNWTEIGEKSKIQFNRITYNRMTSCKAQEDYIKKTDEKVIDYRLQQTENIFYSITKTEFDYFNSLKS